MQCKYNYDPVSGIFTNKNGRIVGSYTKKYGRLFTKDGQISLSRLAVYLMTGSWPDGEVDHIDGDTHNNKWCNLRVCTRKDNALNKGISSRNSTGYKGVYQSKSTGKYHAQVRGYGQSLYLGTFETAEEAAVAYNEKATELHKEFVRLNSL